MAVGLLHQIQLLVEQQTEGIIEIVPERGPAHEVDETAEVTRCCKRANRKDLCIASTQIKLKLEIYEQHLKLDLGHLRIAECA